MPLLSDEEFAKVHGAIEAQRAQSQAATLLDGLRTQSQAAARAVQVGKTLDLPPGFVLADPEQNELLAKAKNLRDATDTSPVLKNWIASHPLNTSLAQNDVGTLGQMESTLAPKSIGQSLLDAPMEIIKGLGGSFNKAATGVNMAAGAFPAMYGYITGNTDAADWWFKNMVDPGVQKQQVFAPDANARFAEKAGNMAGGVLGMLSQATLSGTTAAPGAALTPTATAAQAVSGAVEQGTKAMLFPALSDALDTGRRVYTETNDAAAAVKAAQAQYISSTAMGVFPMAVPGSLGVRAASGFAVGAATGEVARQYMNASMPEGMQTPFDIEELMLSGLAGSIFGAVGHHDEAGYHKQIRQGMLELRRARVAEEAGAVLDKASQLATASELRTNAPDHFKEVARMMTEDGAIKDVYVEADHLAQSMDKAGITAEELRTILPEVAEQMKMGLETQGLVRIPTADYLTHIAGGKLDPLLREELRYNDPNGMTLKQAKEWQGGEAERMKEMAASLVKDETERSAFKASQQAVQDKIHADLNATGKFSTDVNRVKATITAAIISRIAALEKVTPEAAWEKYGSTVRNGALMGGGELDQAQRAIRDAEAAGFDSSKQWYHGTTAATNFRKMKAGKGGIDELGEGIYITDQPMYADAWARGEGGRVLPLFLKKGDIFDATKMGRTAYQGVEREAMANWWLPLVKRIRERNEALTTEQSMTAKGDDLWKTWLAESDADLAKHIRDTSMRGGLNEWLKRAGYVGMKNDNSQIPGQVVVFDPTHLRSPWAKFDPAKVGSADLLAQQPFSGPEKATTPLPQGTTHIDVDGVQRPATNSNGQPIHWSEEGVRNFWRWFGDSKVVDAEGRPMIVYHGTDAEFEVFSDSKPNFFTRSHYYATAYGKDVVSSYLDIASPFDPAKDSAAREIFNKEFKNDSLGKDAPQLVEGQSVPFQWADEFFGFLYEREHTRENISYDGMVVDEGHITGVYGEEGAKSIVPLNNYQIKSATGNNGDFSRNDGSILRQAAYHGTPHNVDRFSTDHIGTGEGAQAYGWGLYFAENKGVADGYRKALTKAHGEVSVKVNGRVRKGDAIRYAVEKLAEEQDTVTKQDLIDYFKNRISDIEGRQVGADGGSPALTDALLKEQRKALRDVTAAGSIEVSIKKQPGALYTVDIPDEHVANFLLWDKPLSEQPEGVQKALGVTDGYFYLPPINGEKPIMHGGSMSGLDLYRELESLADSDKAASKYLDSLGVKGIKYLDGNSRDSGKGSHNLVVFDDSIINITHKDGSPVTPAERAEFLQDQANQNGPTVKGTYSPSTRSIALLKDADLTTYLHETGHWALDTYARIAASPEAPAAIREDMGKVLEWFGIKGTDLGVDPVATLKALTPEHTYTPEELQALDKAVRSEVSPRNAAKGLAKDIGGVDEQTLARIVDDLRKTGNASDPLEVWNAMSLDEQRPYHEKFARGFETYLMEGKAPSQALQPFFARIKQWMIDAYKSITSLGVTLTPEVRGVFDRMLASEQEIAQAKAARVFEPFAVEKPAGVSAEDWANYTSMDAKADADAVATLQARSVRDMKWLSGAKSRALRDIQKQAEAARKEVRAEVEAQVNDEPVYRMQDWLKANRITKDNIDPDMLADMFGFSSGDEAMRALAEAQPKAEVIEGMTDRRMLEEHGELSTPDAIERAANEAVHNEARARFMATGLKMLANSPISATVLRKGAREAARAAVGNTRVRDLNPNQFLAAEAKANAEVLKLAAKDTEGAVRAQRSALLNNQLVAEAYKAQERVQKALDHFKKLGGETAQGNMRGEMLDQLNALLARFDLRTSINPDKERVPLGEWVKAEAERLSAVMPDLPEWVTNDLYKTSYKNLTVDEMLGLFDSVRQLEHMARREQKQYMAVRAMEFAAERGAVLAEIRKHWAKAFDKDTGEPLGLEPDFVPSIKKAVSKMGDKFSGEFLSPETILSILGGGDFTVVNESLFSRLSNRSDWKSERLSGIYKELKPLFDQYSMKEKFDFGRKDITTPAGLPTPMTRENALMVALLHGNPEGRQRLENYGLGEARQRQIIELLDERDAKLANAIWKLFDTNLWPELEALNQRTRGKAPPKVEALPYTTNAGEWTGGYMRLKYDTNLEERAHRLDEGQAVKELLGGGLGMSSKTNQGTSTERKQNVTLRPRLTLDVFAEAVNETVHDLAYREAVADTMRMLNDKGIQNAVKQVVGTEGYRALVGRVREVAAPPRNPSGFVENAISIARHNTVINLMSGVKTALQNLTGLAPALAEVNAGTLGAEVVKFYGPGMAERTRFAMEQSAFMRNRFDHYDRDLQTNIKKLSVKGSLRPDDSTFLALMGFVDRGVTVPLWNAAFKQGMERFANDQPKAVEYADHIVRQTQGSGRDVDLAQIMSGHGGWGQLKKAFTMFYSYFNGQLGLITKHAVKTKLDAAEGNTAVEAGKMAAKMMAIVVVPTVLTELLMRGWQIEGEDDEAQKRRWAGAFVKYGAGFFPFVRDIVPGIWAVATGDKYFGTKVSPIDSAAEGVVRATKSAIDVAKGENDEKDTKNLIMGVGYLAGVPGKLVADTVEGTRLWLNGEAGPQAILLGPPPKP